MYTFHYSIGLHDTDAAGVLFSANIIRICHQAYEAMMMDMGFAIGDILKHREFGLPLAHVAADFSIPLRTSDPVTIEVRTEELGSSSFQLGYRILNEQGLLAATASTVHVCVDVDHYRSKPLPETLRQCLAKLWT